MKSIKILLMYMIVLVLSSFIVSASGTETGTGMKLEIYTLLMSIAGIVIFLGYYSNSVLLKSVGFILLALINIGNIDSGWAYVTGETITQIDNSTIVHTTDYSTYSNDIVNLSRLFSFLFTTVGIFGAYLISYEERKSRKEDSL